MSHVGTDQARLISMVVVYPFQHKILELRGNKNNFKNSRKIHIEFTLSNCLAKLALLLEFNPKNDGTSQELLDIFLM